MKQYINQIEALGIYYVDFGDLVIIADQISNSDCKDINKNVLFMLLEHDNPVIREIALCGIEIHIDDPEVSDKINHMCIYDESPAIRSIAWGIFSDYTVEKMDEKMV